MLEECENIFECEKILSHQLFGITLLGQIQLTGHDIERLRECIHAEIVQQGSDCIHCLVEYTPVSVACFLVWQGILHYDGASGDYWSAVTRLFPYSSASEKLGSFFLDFLKRRQLPAFTR